MSEEKKSKKYKDKLFLFLHYFSFVIALIFFILSFIYVVSRNDLILKDLWDGTEIRDIITLVSIITATAISILLFFVSQRTNKINENIYKLEKTRLKMEMIPLFKQEKKINEKINSTIIILEEIANNFSSFIIHKKIIDKKILSSGIEDEYLEEREKRFKEIEKTSETDDEINIKKMRIIFGEQSPVDKAYEKMLDNFLKESEQIKSLIADALKHIEEVSKLYTIEVGILMEIEIERSIKGDIQSLLTKRRANTASIEQLFDSIKYHNAGTYTLAEFPVFKMWSETMDDVLRSAKDLKLVKNELNNKVKEYKEKNL